MGYQNRKFFAPERVRTERFELLAGVLEQEAAGAVGLPAAAKGVEGVKTCLFVKFRFEKIRSRNTLEHTLLNFAKLINHHHWTPFVR